MFEEQKTTPTTLMEPAYLDEPHRTQEYADMLSRVAAEHQPVIVRRRGVDVAAVISLEDLRLLQELFARHEAETLAAEIDWSRLAKPTPPAQWFEGDEPKPF
jgi:prevent-host-death family protein